MKYEYYSDKDNWEQARLISYLIAQTNSNKTLHLTDIIKFPWETENANNTSISNEDVARLKEKAEQYLKLHINE